MISHIPFLDEQWDVVIFFLGIAAFTLFSYKRVIANGREVQHEERFFIIAALCVIGILIAQFMFHVFTGTTLWPHRYYTVLYFFLPVAFVLMIQPRSSTFMLLLCIGLFSRICFEYQKIEPRMLELNGVKKTLTDIDSNHNCAIAVVENDDTDYSEFVFWGELLVRGRNDYRNREIYFVADAVAAPERWAYFKNLQQLGYNLKLINRSENPGLLPGCVCQVFTADGNESSLFKEIPHYKIK